MNLLNPFNRLTTYASFVRFSHSVFALPFALTGALLAIHQGDPRRWELKRAIQRRYAGMLPKVGLDSVLRTIDHAVKVAGVDHVGLGSDFDGISGMAPAGLEDVSKYPALVKGLIELKYSDADIRKILGENLLRGMRANEDVAAGQRP